MKKVLIFSLNYYPRFIGGAEVAIKEITDHIAPEDIEFHMVTLQFDSNLPKKEKIGNVLVHRIGFARPGATIAELKKFPLHLNKYFYQFFAARYAAKLHAQNHYDGVWAMMAHSCAIPAGIFKKKYPQVKYLLTLQEGDPPEYIEKLMKPVWPLFKQGFTSADALQPISNFLRAWGMRMGFTGEARVIPNAVDVAHYSQSITPEEREHLRTELGIQPNEIVLVSTSRLVHKNAMDDVIRAMPLLPSHIRFINFGFGPDKDKLQTLANELNVSERVSLSPHPGHDILPRYLQACDIFIRASRSEGMGISFLEAMAAGLPVIATQEGGIADFLFDAERNPGQPSTGWAVDADSPEQIAQVVQRIIANPEEVAKTVATARAMTIEKYDWNTIAQDMKGLFESLLGSDRA